MDWELPGESRSAGQLIWNPGLRISDCPARLSQLSWCYLARHRRWLVRMTLETRSGSALRMNLVTKLCEP